MIGCLSSSFWGLSMSIEFKASSDSCLLIFLINVGKRRIRHRTTLNFKNLTFNRFWVDLGIFIRFHSHWMYNPPRSVIFLNKIARIWTGLIRKIKQTHEISVSTIQNQWTSRFKSLPRVNSEKWAYSRNAPKTVFLG